MRAIKRAAACLILFVGMAGCAQVPYSQPSASPSATASVPTPSAPAPSSTAPSPSETPVTDPTRSVSQPETSSGSTTTSSLPAPDSGVSISWVDTTSSSITLSAFVPEVVEDGGRCQVTATQGGATRSVTVSAFADAQSTLCDPITVDGLSAGVWTVRVVYTSSAHHLTSAQQKVTIS